MYIIKNSRKITAKTEDFDLAIVLFLKELGSDDALALNESTDSVKYVLGIWLNSTGRFGWGKVSITKK